MTVENLFSGTQSIKKIIFGFSFNKDAKLIRNEHTTTEYGTIPSSTARPIPQKIHDKLLFCKYIFIIAVLCAMLASSQFAINYYFNRNNIIICNTTECIRTASSYKLSMDETIDPCDDFHAYACGHWKDEYNFAPIKFSRSTYSYAQDRIDYQIRNVLMKNNSEDDVARVKQSRSFFKSCMNVTQRQKLGVSAMFKHLNNAGLPAIPRFFKKSGKSAPFDWLATDVNMKKYFNLDLFIAVTVGPSFEDRAVNVLHLKEPSDTILPRPISNLNRLLNYRPYVESGNELVHKATIAAIIEKVIANATKTPVTKNAISNATNVIFDVWKNLRSLRHAKKTSYLKFLADDLQKETDYYFLTRNYSKAEDVWHPYFTSLFDNEFNDTFKFGEDYIYTTDGDLDYLNRLVYALQKYPDDVLELYSWWSAVKVMAFYVIPSHRDDHIKSCMTLTAGNFVDAVAYELTKDKFLGKLMPKAEMMLNKIKLALTENICNSVWLDEYSKLAIIEKIKSITSLVGLPEEWIDIEAMNDRAEYFTIGDDTYLDNLMEYVKMIFPATLEALRTNEIQDLSSPIQVNAYNAIRYNLIYIPFSIMQVPFYNLGLEVLNYGAVGSVMGHELLHGFDSNGIKHDQFGVKRQWLSEDIAEIFKNKTECLVEQYNSYFIYQSGVHVNGENTLSENIADTEGLRQAFSAFLRYEEENQLETRKKLPGFEYFTNRQMFFLAFAQSRCADSPMEKTLHDVHSPDKFRIIGSLQNSEEFSEAFKCQPGTYMNPEKPRCTIW